MRREQGGELPEELWLPLDPWTLVGQGLEQSAIMEGVPDCRELEQDDL